MTKLEAVEKIIKESEGQHFFKGGRLVYEEKMGNKPHTEFAGAFVGVKECIVEVRVYDPDNWIAFKVYRKGTTPRTYKLCGVNEALTAIQNIETLH